MYSLQSGIGPEERLTYETQGVNFENISQAKSENLGKTLYILTAKKKTDLAVFGVFFWNNQIHHWDFRKADWEIFSCHSVAYQLVT